MNFVSDTVKSWYSSIGIIDRPKLLFSVSSKAVVVDRSLTVVLQSGECNGRKNDKCLNQKFIKMDTPQPRWWSCGTQWSIRTLVVDLDANIASMGCLHHIPFPACKSLFFQPPSESSAPMVRPVHRVIGGRCGKEGTLLFS